VSQDDVTLRIGLRGQQETSKGFRTVAADERKVGEEAERAGAKAKRMGAAFATAGKTATGNLGAGLALVGRQARYGAVGFGLLTTAGAKWGLSFNAQVESARMRFRVFTDDVDGLTKAVQRIDLSSQFNFGDLADQAALLGNFGVNAAQIPSLLQGIANAAAASGQGTQGLQRIALDLGQIQSQGKVTGDELRDLAQAGAPVQKVLRDTFNLTDKQMQNVGAQGLDATKFLQAVTQEWNSGKMAGAAQRQLHTLGGQWQLFTGNAQKLAGAATHGLAIGLERDVLPAANRAAEQITRIFGTDGLSNHEKLRQARMVIRRELEPIARDVIQDIQDADLAGKLDHEFERAMDKIAVTAVTRAPHVVGEFVNAWLSAGPWAKLASGAWLAHKFGLDKGALALLKGSKGGGGLGGLGKGVTPVYVTNWGGGAHGPSGGPWSNDPSRKPYNRPMPPASRGSRIRAALGRGARTAGQALLVGAAYEEYLSVGHSLGIGNDHGRVTPVPEVRYTRPSRQDRATAVGEGLTWLNDYNYSQPPVHVSVQVGGREIVRAYTQANDRQRARGN
jgi:tape measure domain-containing protein